MRVETKRVYYCDFCKKHSLRPLTKHEERCTGNPDRACYWQGVTDSSGGDPHLKAGELRPHIEWCKQFRAMDEDTLDVLRKRLDGCPPCLLAVLRQARPEDVEVYDWAGPFNYDAEKERFELDRARSDEMATWV